MAAFEERVAIDGASPQSTKSAKELEGSTLSSSDYANQPQGGKTWKILKQRHIDYDRRMLDVRKQDLLYEGGFQMNEPHIAQLFCPKLRSEEDSNVYKDRVASAAYIPTFSKLITGLTSSLFSQDLSVMEAADHDDATTAGGELTNELRDYYKEFVEDCDGQGTSLHDFMHHQTKELLIHSFYFFGVDYPKGEAQNLLEQEQMGLDKPILFKVDIASVFDWKMLESNPREFEWIKMVTCIPHQPTPFDPPMQMYFVKTYELKEVMGKGVLSCYECYQSDPLPLGKEPKNTDILKKVDEGDTSFKSINIIYTCLDDGIAVGKKLAPLAAEHFNRTTIENHSTNKACLTVPVLYRGEMFPGGDSLPNPTVFGDKSFPRGKVNSNGIYELGDYNTDKFDIVESEGKALAFIHKQNEDLDEKMHSVVHQMAQSLKQASSTSGKTAASKQEDRHSTEMLLSAIADAVFSLTKRVFKLIAASHEGDEDIIWEVKGLSSSTQDDRAVLAVEAGLMGTLEFPSITAKKEYYYRIMSKLNEGTDQSTLQTIRKEIEEAVEDTYAEDQKIKQQTAAVAAIPPGSISKTN